MKINKNTIMGLFSVGLFLLISNQMKALTANTVDRIAFRIKDTTPIINEDRNTINMDWLKELRFNSITQRYGTGADMDLKTEQGIADARHAIWKSDTVQKAWRAYASTLSGDKQGAMDRFISSIERGLQELNRIPFSPYESGPVAPSSDKNFTQAYKNFTQATESARQMRDLWEKRQGLNKAPSRPLPQVPGKPRPLPQPPIAEANESGFGIVVVTPELMNRIHVRHKPIIDKVNNTINTEWLRDTLEVLGLNGVNIDLNNPKHFDVILNSIWSSPVIKEKINTYINQFAGNKSELQQRIKNSLSVGLNKIKQEARK